MSIKYVVSALLTFIFFFSSRRRHTRFDCDWSSDVCSSDLWQWSKTGSSELRSRNLHCRKGESDLNMMASPPQSDCCAKACEASADYANLQTDRKSVV